MGLGDLLSGSTPTEGKRTQDRAGGSGLYSPVTPQATQPTPWIDLEVWRGLVL